MLTYSYVASSYMYIEPIGAIYEGFSVAALFLLVLEWVVPDGRDREKFFDNLEMRGRRGKVQPGGSLKWFKASELKKNIQVKLTFRSAHGSPS